MQQQEATATPRSKHLDVSSDDNWLVQCLTLAAFAAMATSQIIGENVLVAMM
jgi:hypothetical protein